MGTTGLDPLPLLSAKYTDILLKATITAYGSLRICRNLLLFRIKQVSGIADVTNFGGITTQFQIELDPHKLEQYGLSLSEVTETISKNNVSAGGSMLPREIWLM
jgi:cobalt-zinc-cadmium resistance protein CzcA